jgi:hypothetical protein
VGDPVRRKVRRQGIGKREQAEHDGRHAHRCGRCHEPAGQRQQQEQRVEADMRGLRGEEKRHPLVARRRRQDPQAEPCEREREHDDADRLVGLRQIESLGRVLDELHHVSAEPERADDEHHARPVEEPQRARPEALTHPRVPASSR